jgi:hypothetical protein
MQKNKFENFWTRNEESFRNISKYFWLKITKPCHMIFQIAYKNMRSPTRKVKVAIWKSVFRWFETNNEKKWSKNRTFFIIFGTFFKNFSKFDEFEMLNSNSKFSKRSIIPKFCSYKSCMDYETLLWSYIEGNIFYLLTSSHLETRTPPHTQKPIWRRYFERLSRENGKRYQLTYFSLIEIKDRIKWITNNIFKFRSLWTR